jgi:putative tricarboxylic transport membrane protein
MLSRSATLAAMGLLGDHAAWAQQTVSGNTHAAAAGAKAAASAHARLAERLRIVIPGNTGGGWDQTGRALGAALIASGAADQVAYENIGGKGGTMGLAKYVQDYSKDANTLLIGGMVMVGAIALHKPTVDLAQVQPLARLTTDNIIVVVPAASPIRTTRDLMVALRTQAKNLPMAGGSAGGVDHMFAGVLMRAAKASPEDLVYRAFTSGPEVTQALQQGQAAIGISGYSEFSDALASGTLRVVGTSARRTSFGIPTFRDEGVDAEMANWRAVFTGAGVPPGRAREMLSTVERATGNETWARALKQTRWDAALMSGKDLKDFLDFENTTAKLMMQLLKLKA